MHPQPLLLVLLLSLCTIGFAQVDDGNKRISPKEFAIPASPVFDVMGVTPSQINRTADIKDFKVDWSFKSWRLNPNLALQSQPIWEMFFNRKDLGKYQNASRFMRQLASLDVSMGTVQDESGDRRIGYALKANLFRQRDPLLARELYADIGERYQAEKTELDQTLKQLQQQLDSTTNILEKQAIRNTIRETEEKLFSINSRRKDEINERAKIFVAENWNASSLDIAFGRVYSYQTDSSGSLKSLRLNRNTGYSGWINGSLGISKRLLLTGLFRSSWYEEELNFLIRNNDTGEESSQLAVADNTLLTMGMNLRYGGPYFTFFVEFLYEKKGLKTPVEALSKVFDTPAGFEVVSNTVKWDVVQPNTISFGGDWRLNRSVMLNYGMRCIFDRHWTFERFIPVVSVACMMR
ncbi:hypothetical protein ACFSQD_04420 [Flavihumibacter stibioxidans]|uniref:Uncharacterized protein n=1 Tax=Flavihumibacter stibioxidans TaxID=1834163 RepID=A0ABR7M3G3_9BACT|nr:hypothetical protein [Flavihumibacter stibioxidans]MBC6489552.1 hypothetical protein [Flavihumibacter stibioxidans]